MAKNREQDSYLWERQHGETEEAWEAFLTYLHLEKRRVQTVCEQLSKSRTIISRWKSKWFWDERVEAYDSDLQREAFKEAVKERKEMNKRHVNLAMHLQVAVADALKTKDFSKMSDKDIVAFVRMATELERGARMDNLSMYPKQAAGENDIGDTEDVVIYVPDNGLGEIDNE